MCHDKIVLPCRRAVCTSHALAPAAADRAKVPGRKGWPSPSPRMVHYDNLTLAADTGHFLHATDESLPSVEIRITFHLSMSVGSDGGAARRCNFSLSASSVRRNNFVAELTTVFTKDKRLQPQEKSLSYLRCQIL